MHYRGSAAQVRHRHRHSTLSIVVAGGFEESTSAQSVRALPGSLVIKPAEFWHADQYGPRGACLAQLEFDDPSHDRSIAECGYRWFESAALIRAVLTLCNGDVAQHDGAEAFLWDFLHQKLPDVADQSKGSCPAWWRAALELLDRCTEKPVSVSEVAQLVGVHPVHLARVFRRRQGQSIRSYMRECRVLAAWRACASETDSLAALALRFHFSDQAHMTRAFRRTLGISPAQLRRLGRE